MRSMRAEPITRSAGIIFINGETLGRVSHKMPAILQASKRNGFGGFPIRNRTMRVTHTDCNMSVEMKMTDTELKAKLDSAYAAREAAWATLCDVYHAACATAQAACEAARDALDMATKDASNAYKTADAEYQKALRENV
jgi:hypothetical protein